MKPLNPIVESAIKIFNSKHLTETKLNALFTLFISSYEKDLELPEPDDMIIQFKKIHASGLNGKVKLKRDKKSGDVTIEHSYHVNAGCNGDWHEEDNYTPAIFYFKFLYDK